MELSREEVERYSRHLVLPEFGLAGQTKLKASRVMGVGAGGLGVPALVCLAAAGVGKIGIFDHDVVEASNLHRQTIYSQGDVGRPKAAAAAEKLRPVNPHVAVDFHAEKLDSSNAMQVLEGYDLVLDCTDNLPARYLISDACALLHKPDVYASVLRFDGQATVFDAARGPCYRCLFPEPPPPDEVQGCAVSGVLGVVPGIMGSIQAAQAVNLVTGAGSSLVGRLLLYNGTDMTFSEVRVGKNRECPVCGDRPTLAKLIDYDAFCDPGRPSARVGEGDPAELKLLLDGGSKVQLLDVREPFESALCRIRGSKLIPLGELERRVGELDPSAETIAYCHVGVKSARAIQFLKSRGFANARSLKGGVRAWAEVVDPSMPVY